MCAGGVLIAVRRLNLEEDYRYLRMPSRINARDLGLQLLKSWPSVQLDEATRSAPSWANYPDLMIKDRVGGATSGVDSNAFHYRTVYHLCYTGQHQEEEVKLKEGDCLEVTTFGQGG